MKENKESFDEVLEKFESSGAECSFSTGKYARRSNAAIIARMGETVVLVTVDISDPREGCDYFPLNVEYIERMYAGGVISSSRFVKRERHPSDDASLAARMIDRAIRCRFPSDYRNEVQIVLTVLSYDSDYDPIIIGISAISAALMISEAPFDGFIAGLRIGVKENKIFVCNKDVEVEGNNGATQMNFVLGTDGELITMLDVDGEEISDDQIVEAMELGVKSSKQMLDAQKNFVAKVKKLRGSIYKPEYESSALPKDLISVVRKDHKKAIEKAIMLSSRSEKEDAVDDIKEQLYKEFEGKYSKNQLSDSVYYVSKEIVRKLILVEKKRTDGRKLDEIRPLSVETGILPRVHGSALFTRGGTQALTVTTLGSRKLALLQEGMEGSETTTYMHHYYAPAYTVGEAGKYRYYPKRREVGHGALAEKALSRVIPDGEVFPYTIRVVSEIMSQCGSSSMASVCGSTVSLMDAGVPIKKPVAGIAIGVVTSDDLSEFELLTDMGDFEDYYGDMDFKVAGTRDGIT
ncbi:MAG: polyribonucleotide nucleotidyltransferase, partial [Patescibacteria group bacterium]|nr:polyribonucleotide nucleotidyltransferase [Patescibacteria group bacterium]